MESPNILAEKYDEIRRLDGTTKFQKFLANNVF